MLNKTQDRHASITKLTIVSRTMKVELKTGKRDKISKEIKHMVRLWVPLCGFKHQ